jgi:hypothetical protein
MSKILNVRLPNATPREYSPEQFNQLVRSLEQVILQLNTTYTPTATENTAAQGQWFGGAAGASGIAGPQGAQQLLLPHGSFRSDQDQTAASTTVGYAVTYNVTDLSEGVYVTNSSRVNVDYAGVYNVQFSFQLINTDSQIHDVDIWFSKNGTNIDDSNSRYSITSSHGGVDGGVIAALNFYLDLNPGDYFEIYWSTTNTAVSLQHLPTATSPTRPATPSVILTVGYISSLS